MKKREYTAPAVEEIYICGCNVICSSLAIDNEEINTGGRAKRDERDIWEDIWQ